MAQKTNVVPEPFVISFFRTGLFLNRQPMYAALINIGIQIAQFHDALLDGVNIELTDRLSLARRPPFTRYCSQPMASDEVALQMYSVRDANGDVYPLLDTNQNLYSMTPTSLTSILTKSTGAGRSSVQEIGGLSYICDGVDSIILDGTNTHPWGVAAPTTLPMLQNTLTYPGYWIPSYQTTAGGSLLDYLGNIEYSTTPGVSGISLPVWNPSLGGYTNDGLSVWENVGPLSYWIASNLYSAPAVIADTNGNIQLVTSGGTTGATAPTWNTTFGGTTSDGTVTWTNIGAGTVVAYAGYSYVYCFRTLSGNLSTASPPSQNTGPILSSQAVAPLTITAYSISSDVLTITAKNTLVAGQSVMLNGFPNSTFLNGQAVQVSATGLSGTSFQAVFAYTDTSASELGQAYPVITTLIGNRSSNVECNATYSITQVSLAANVVTITCNNTLSEGLAVRLSGLVNATWLNGQTVYVNTATANSFTADFTHSDYSAFPDMGTATFLAVEIYRTDDGGGIYYFDGAAENPLTPNSYTSGNITAGAGTNLNNGGTPWTNPNNVTSSSSYATVSEYPPSGSPSYNFLATGNTVVGTGLTSPVEGSFSYPVVVGTTAVIFFGSLTQDSSYNITGVTDNLGNTWTQAVVNADNSSDPYYAQIYCYTSSITTGGDCTVSINFTGVAQIIQMAGQTYTGMSQTVDITAGNYYFVGAGGDTSVFNNSGALGGNVDVGGTAYFRTTNPNDVIFTAIFCEETTGQIAPGEYTNAPSNIEATQQLFAAWDAVSATGDYRAEWQKTDTKSYSYMIGVSVAFHLVPYSVGSYYLQAQQFDDLDIPGGVNPLGINVSLVAEYNGGSDLGVLTAQLLKGGTPVGNILSSNLGNTGSPAGGTPLSFGGDANLWGEPWIFNDFNQSNFGVQFTASLLSQPGGPYTIGIREVQIQVTGDSGSLYWTFNDILPDAQLDNEAVAELAHLNDPPPGQPGSTVASGGNLLAYWSNRLWMAVGNYLYFDGGPDVLNGVAEECWPPANVWTFPGDITGLEPTTGGLIVTTSAEYWAILGGPQTLTFYPERIFGKFGVNSPNCIAEDGDNLFVYTTQNQCMALVGQNRNDIGLPVVPLFVDGQNTQSAVVSPFSSANSYLCVHRMGEDAAVWLGNGSESLLRYSFNTGCWSTVYQPLLATSGSPPTGVISVGAINSVETSLGIFSLLAAPTTAGGYVYTRNLGASSFEDNGYAYPTNTVIGSIVMSNPGTDLVPCHAISIYCANVGSVPKVSFLPNEIYATTTKPFVPLPVVQPEVGQLPQSVSLMALRYPTLSNVSATPILIRHLQVKIDFGTDTVANELMVVAFKNNKESSI